jgi:hypothetical protein
MMMTTRNPSSAESLAAGVGFDLLGSRLGGDAERSVGTALKAGAVFPGGGDALANFRNPQGWREMLWPQDLDAIALNGRTANGCRIAGAGSQ